jgi:hypothetical protein
MWAAPVRAEILCQTRRGVVVVRSACKSKEKVLDITQFGPLGPKGSPGDAGPEGDKGDRGDPAEATLTECSPDSVRSGTVCIDRYEASVWRVPAPLTLNAALVAKLQAGTATAADLAAGEATQLGIASDDYAPCADRGQNCTNDIYAVSLPGVTPSRRITWLQAQQACKNMHKRLPTNVEWQAAVAGTPDPGGDDGSTDCKSTGFAPVATGSRTSCVSFDGAFDMVGNLYEWVADWVPRSTACGAWTVAASPTHDHQCLAGADTTGEPGTLLRGGYFNSGASAGPLTINGTGTPAVSDGEIGFRCAR